MGFARLALLACAAAAACPAATVIGMVVDAATLEPIRKAEVSLATTQGEPQSALAVTGADGQFRFDGLPAGSYRLGAWRQGFLSIAPGIFTQLAAGEVRAGLVLKLQRGAVISGQVLDTEGDPIENAMVQLMIRVYRRGKPEWGQRLSASTDGRGFYRMQGLAAGTFRVRALARFQGLQPSDPVVNAQQTTPQYGFAVQFFPGADSVDGAAPVVVKPGAEVTGIDFRLPYRPRATLVFAVRGLPEAAARDTEVQVRATAVSLNTSMGTGGRAGQPMRLVNVDAGSYLVTAKATVAGQPYYARQTLEAPGGETTAVLTFEPGIDLSGTLRVEGGQAAPPHVKLVEGERLDLWPQPSAPVDADGRFVLRGVPPGLWDIDVEPLPPGAYIQSMLLDSQDVLTEDMVLGPDSKGPLKIVVSLRGARLEGDVQGLSPDAPPPLVLVAPQGANARVLGFFASTRADEKGHFAFKGLRPGAYRVYALDHIDPAEWENPDFLAPYAAQAEAVELRERALVNAHPRLLSLPPGGPDQ